MMDEKTRSGSDASSSSRTAPDFGGDAQDHEVCLVPGIGIDFARCRRSLMGDGSDDMGDPGRAAESDLRRAADRRE